jgi:hypothetical protein
MKLKSLFTVIAIMAVLAASAQIPKFKRIPTNDDKQYEYKAEAEVDRAGTGDLLKRLEYWSKNYFENGKARVSIDPENKNVLLVDTEIPMAESHFSVSRVHKDRVLKFQIQFDCEKKTYVYAVKDIKYKTLETYKKGDIQYDGLLSDLKSPTKASVEEEVDRFIQEMIIDFKKSANTSLDDLKNPKEDKFEEEDIEEEEEEEDEDKEEEIIAPKIEVPKQKKSGKKDK